MANEGALNLPYLLLCMWCCMQVFPSVASAQFLPGIPGVPQSDVFRMADDLRDGGFTIAAVVVQALKSFVPYHTTIFIPSNDAIQSFSNVSASNIPAIVEYHVIDLLASSRALSKAPLGAKLPTLIPGKYLTVTSNTTDNLSVNNVPIVQPNLCQTTKFVTCHGISKVLDPNSMFAAGPQQISPVAAPQISPEAGGGAEYFRDGEANSRSAAVSGGSRVGGAPGGGPSGSWGRACVFGIAVVGFIYATGSNMLI